MADLDGASVFLSASFPSGERGELYAPYDVDAVADAVTAVVDTVLASNGRLVFGGHPTITPLVLRMASRHGRPGVIDVYQSLFFEWDFTEATKELARRGYGRIIKTPSQGSRQESLDTMRERMLSEPERLAGGVFIGGMQGIEDEFNKLAELRDDLPRIPLAAPGGAAASLADVYKETFDRPEWQGIVRSSRYPLVATRVVEILAGH
jgi:hypothetical protein